MISTADPLNLSGILAARRPHPPAFRRRGPAARPGATAWQYDVMVALILLFVFLMPREWFRDQPRIPRASNIAVLPGENGSNMYLIDPELLSGVPGESTPSEIGRHPQSENREEAVRAAPATHLRRFGK